MGKNRNSLNIGVDIGGTKIALGLVTSEVKIIGQKSFPTSVDRGPDWIIEHVIEEINNLVTKANIPLQDIHSIIFDQILND